MADPQLVEVRGEFPAEHVAVLDAIAQITPGASRMSLMREILAAYVNRKLMEATVIHRVAGRNGMGSAKRLAIGRMTVYRLLGSGKLVGVKIRSLWRISEADLAAYIESCRSAVKDCAGKSESVTQASVGNIVSRLALRENKPTNSKPGSGANWLRPLSEGQCDISTRPATCGNRTPGG